MNFEEELFKLNEEELFGKVKSIDIEQSDVLKNFGYLISMVQEAIDILKAKDNILYEDAREISKIQNECIKWLGEAMEKINNYN